MRFFLIIFSLLPSLAFAGQLADAIGITAALDEAKESALTVGSVVILFVTLLAFIPIAIRLIKMADPYATRLAQARVSLDAYKAHTTTPSGRYGASYKRQTYENHVHDQLMDRVQFLEFSSRLTERELEWLKSQKDDINVTDIESDISVAEQKMRTAEEELEELRSQMDFYEQNRDLDIEDAEIVEDGEIDEEPHESPWDSVEDLDSRERFN